MLVVKYMKKDFLEGLLPPGAGERHMGLDHLRCGIEDKKQLFRTSLLLSAWEIDIPTLCLAKTVSFKLPVSTSTCLSSFLF
jgi:hypothetical protein